MIFLHQQNSQNNNVQNITENVLTVPSQAPGHRTILTVEPCKYSAVFMTQENNIAATNLLTVITQLVFHD